MDYMQLLLQHDDPVSWMEPADFDQDVAEERVREFVHELSTILGIFVKAETGELLQDAIYHSEAFLPVGEDRQPSIRFSRFDALATLFLGEKVPQEWQSVVEHVLKKH